MTLTEWEQAKSRIKIGSRVKGIVKLHKPFGRSKKNKSTQQRFYFIILSTKTST